MTVASSAVLSPQTEETAQVTLFYCANSGRGGMCPPSAVRQRPAPLPMQWPFTVQEIMVPCGGKIQPEHILKSFEAGADLVCVIACDEDNCHYLEGSSRARVRVEYVRLLLNELGLDGERLLLFNLPGSAREDMALGCAVARTAGVSPASGAGGTPAVRSAAEESAGRMLKAIAEEIAGRLKELGMTPLRQVGGPSGSPGDPEDRPNGLPL